MVLGQLVGNWGRVSATTPRETQTLPLAKSWGGPPTIPKPRTQLFQLELRSRQGVLPSCEPGSWTSAGMGPIWAGLLNKWNVILMIFFNDFSKYFVFGQRTLSWTILKCDRQIMVYRFHYDELFSVGIKVWTVCILLISNELPLTVPQNIGRSPPPPPSPLPQCTCQSPLILVLSDYFHLDAVVYTPLLFSNQQISLSPHSLLLTVVTDLVLRRTFESPPPLLLTRFEQGRALRDIYLLMGLRTVTV